MIEQSAVTELAALLLISSSQQDCLSGLPFMSLIISLDDHGTWA